MQELETAGHIAPVVGKYRWMLALCSLFPFHLAMDPRPWNCVAHRLQGSFPLNLLSLEIPSFCFHRDSKAYQANSQN